MPHGGETFTRCSATFTFTHDYLRREPDRMQAVRTPVNRTAKEREITPRPRKSAWPCSEARSIHSANMHDGEARKLRSACRVTPGTASKRLGCERGRCAHRRSNCVLSAYATHGCRRSCLAYATHGCRGSCLAANVCPYTIAPSSASSLPQHASGATKARQLVGGDSLNHWPQRHGHTTATPLPRHRMRSYRAH